MPISRRQFLQGLFAPPAQTPAHDPMHHLLNRITWGTRPEELARGRDIGYAAYLEEQLNPDWLDDSTLDAQLQDRPIYAMDRHALYDLQDYESRIYRVMIEGLLLRAVRSQRQLLERMVEFWSDHFNVSLDDWMPDQLLYQRETIRPHALGHFRDLLIATAKSPAMLVYLDNYVNVASHPNENYARELLELHTLGVDGGYTELDVKEVARAFSGWTVHNRTRSGFYFNAGEHDFEAKTVLGHELPAGRGLEDGLHVLSLLAHHPATARFICTKLCVRFVSDTPPATLVDQLVQVWQENDGEIRAVLRALFLSDEFPAAAGQKLRRPLEFFVGLLRSTGAEIREWWALWEMLQSLGQMPYGWHPPNGYPDVAAAWLSTNGLLARWNIAMRLTHGAYEDPYGLGWGTTAPLRERIGDPQTIGQLVDEVAAQVFGAPLVGTDRAQFVAYVAENEDVAAADQPLTGFTLARKLGSLFGLMLASPQFQWR